MTLAMHMQYKVGVDFLQAIPEVDEKACCDIELDDQVIATGCNKLLAVWAGDRKSKLAVVAIGLLKS
jgi:hypothetical protein